VKSAVLLAALQAEGPTRIFQHVETRDHTERLLRHMASELTLDGSCLVLSPNQPLRSLNLSIPGDPSSAAFFAVGAAIHPDSDVLLEGICLNPHRIRFLEVLSEMGADVTCRSVVPGDWEPRGDVRVRGARLRGVTIGPEVVPGLIDEIPALAVAMAVAEGESHISGAAELRLKESDRIAVLVRELKRFGVPVLERGDGLTITGGTPLKAPVHSLPSGDHRLVMALAILGTAAEGTTRIRQAECVRVSFPEFDTLLKQISRG
ncbi:MAG TPA: 3-phosphoshikimate 1-carboxyvinyltransferase, partial [Candidatus Ozemobacteraceae bacterium]|nr:3-phosphoshikimate 1-carboxyvinyltransferase [Candidatus Ozemobacteraceae bacterium]